LEQAYLSKRVKREKMRGLNGKIALVTGGASGIGEAICWRLAEEGVAIAILDADGVGGARAADALRAAGHTAHAEVCDICDYETVVCAVRGCAHSPFSLIVLAAIKFAVFSTRARRIADARLPSICRARPMSPMLC
jgi:NAD(P)-dependent dehydrogenase (short-subunit alcohol dehydrogenase family)